MTDDLICGEHDKSTFESAKTVVTRWVLGTFRTVEARSGITLVKALVLQGWILVLR